MKSTTVPFTATYGIPKIIEELGLSVFETWDEFEQLVKDIVASDNPFGIAGADA